VAVDNGSTDQTPAVLASFANRLPLRVVSGPTGGKNAALNAGLEFVEGDLTVLTDDDAFPHPNWLIELRKAAEARPEYSIFGGAIVPRWESTPPHWVQWLPEKGGPVYTLTDPSQEEGPIHSPQVFGPNMAIRTAVFQSGARFDPTIGPGSAGYAMGSESQLTGMLGRLGHKSWYVRGAVVEHFIRNEQMRTSWVLKRAMRYGRGRFRLRYLEEKPEGLTTWFDGPQWFGVPRRIFRGMLREGIEAIIALPRSNQQALFTARWRFQCLWGGILEARTSYRDRSERICTGCGKPLAKCLDPTCGYDSGS
jgi:L-malate glycosyltransferase